MDVNHRTQSRNRQREAVTRGTPRGIILVNEAILTPVASSSNDLSAQIGRRPGSHEFFF